MRLSAYLSEHGSTDAQFAKCVRCSPTTVNRVRRGVVMPEARLMARIEAATEGLVTVSDCFAQWQEQQAVGAESHDDSAPVQRGGADGSPGVAG